MIVYSTACTGQGSSSERISGIEPPHERYRSRDVPVAVGTVSVPRS